MKKILLSTTALLVAGAFGAMAAEAPTAKVSGTMRVMFQQKQVTGNLDGNSIGSLNGTSNVGDKSAGNEAGWDIKTQGNASELKFDASGVSDSGLKYSARYDLRPSSGNTTNDEAWTSFAGDFGLVKFGQDDSVAADNFLAGSSVLSGTGGYDGYKDLVLGFTTVGLPIEDDDAKIVYYTPSIAGFTLGVSLAPTVDGTPSASSITAAPGKGTILGVGRSDRIYTFSNQVAFSAVYATELNGAKIKASIVNSRMKANTTGASTDQSAYNNGNATVIGGTVTFGAISVGAGLSNQGKAGVKKELTTDGADKNLGVTQSIGVGYDLGGGTTVGVGYATTKVSLNQTTTTAFKSSRQTNWTTLGVSSLVAPGLTAVAEYNLLSANDGRAVNGGSRGQEILVGTNISF